MLSLSKKVNCFFLLIAFCIGCTSTAAPTATPMPLPEPTPTVTNESSLPSIQLPDIASVVEKVMPSVVQVITDVQQTSFFGQPSIGQSQGSGVFFDNRGYLLTNHHVVENATKVEIALINRQRITAEIIGTDPETDLAVLKVNPANIEDFAIAPIGNASEMRIGDWVITIGSPLGFEGSVTVGVVSAKDRSLNIDASTRLDDLIQTDAVINPGNSGGPLLNLRGEIIGINTAIIRGGQADGIGFAISVDTASSIASQLIDHGRVIRPRIGVMILDVTPATAAELKLPIDEGILVVSVSEDGPASRAGIKANDVIVQIDNNTVSSMTELVRLILKKYQVGDNIRVTVVRNTIYLTFDVTLENLD